MRTRILGAAACILTLWSFNPEPAWGQTANHNDIRGVWQARFQTQWGRAEWSIVLYHDGRFTKTFACHQKMVYEWGTYVLGESFIHLSYQGHLPHGWTYPNSETTFFRFVGPNHIICHDRTVNQTWQAVRVR